MAKRESTAVWQELDPATLQPEAEKAYAAYKVHYAAGKALKAKFEETMQANSGLNGTPKRLAIAYNFGKLSVAVVDREAERGASKKAVSFADFVKAA